MHILSFTDEHSNDNMKQIIESNYRQVNVKVVNIAASEMERIENAPRFKALDTKEEKN